MNEKLSLKELFWLSLTITLGTLIYAQSLSNGFIWDDNTYVWKNPLISSWSGLWDTWFHPKIAEYYPVTFSFIWLEHKLWGFNAWGYHAASLMFHILNALLLFGLLRKVSLRLAGAVALLFTIHPIQVETVAWISEQKNLFCFFFFLLALHAFLDFDATGKKWAYAKTFFFFTLALLSKSVAVCFIFVPFLYGWWKRGSLHKRDLLIVLPFFLLGGLTSIFHLHLINLYEPTPQIPGPALGIIHKMLIAGRIFFFYIQQIIFPKNFMTIHPKWDIDVTRIKDWLYPAGVIVLYLVLLWKRRRLGRAFFALLCFYGLSLFPILGFIDFSWYRFSYVADHFTYLTTPSILLLLCLSISFLFSEIRNNSARKSWAPSPFLKISMATAVAVGIVYLSTLSFFLTRNYKDSATLWTQNLRQNPGSSFACFFLGSLCRENPDICTPGLATFWFEKSARLEPNYLYTHIFLGEGYSKTRRFKEALGAYHNALTLAKPFNKAACYASIANIHLSQHQFAEALLYLEKAIAFEADPAYQRERNALPEPFLQEAAVRRYFGIVYLKLGENQKAVHSFRGAIALYPKEVVSHMGLGTALKNLGDYKGATQAFQEALKLEPKNNTIKNDLAEAQTHLDPPASGNHP